MSKSDRCPRSSQGVPVARREIRMASAARTAHGGVSVAIRPHDYMHVRTSKVSKPSKSSKPSKPSKGTRANQANQANQAIAKANGQTKILG